MGRARMLNKITPQPLLRPGYFFSRNEGSTIEHSGQKNGPNVGQLWLKEKQSRFKVDSISPK